MRYTGEALFMVALAGATTRFSVAGDYVRPPGTVAEESFFRRCIKCGICVEVCPTRALDFVGLTLDVKNIGTPKLNVRHGGCMAWRKECLKCADVCPTQAIKRPATIKDVRMGSIHIRERECINCLLCFRECPIEGALLFPNPHGAPFRKTRDIPSALSDRNSPVKPCVDNSLCIGCGLCAWVCPPRCMDVLSRNERRMRA